MDVNQITASKIKEFRVKLNYKAEDVAKALGMDRANYSKLENGKTEITMKKLQIISDFLKVPIQSFFQNAPHSVSITHGDNSPVQNQCNFNMIDPFIVQTLNDTIKQLQNLLKCIN